MWRKFCVVMVSNQDKIRSNGFTQDECRLRKETDRHLDILEATRSTCPVLVEGIPNNRKQRSQCINSQHQTILPTLGCGMLEMDPGLTLLVQIIVLYIFHWTMLTNHKH